MKVLLLMTSFCILSPVFATSPALVKPQACLSTREFITTLEFLRDHKEFSLDESKLRELAHKVSQGCTGASKRFIQITNVLVKAGIPTKAALEAALTMATSTDEATAAFISIFKGAFLESMLDMDTKSALEIAMDLSHSFSGNRKHVQDNFNQLAEFCVSKKSLDLPVQQCGKMAARVIKSAENFDFKISRDFIALFEYLTGKPSTNLPTYQALEIAEYAVKFGPEAKDNFIKAYEYALAKKGFDVAAKDAIEFGKTMASRSVKKD
jgi:hypothetical protein